MLSLGKLDQGRRCMLGIRKPSIGLVAICQRSLSPLPPRWPVVLWYWEKGRGRCAFPVDGSGRLIQCVPASPGTNLPRVVESVRDPTGSGSSDCPGTHGSWHLGVGGLPWSGGCGAARGPGAVAAVAAGLTSESRAGVGSESWVRVEDEGGWYWARSLPHCPPLPIWAGKERKLSASRASSAPGLGEGRRGRWNLLGRFSVGSAKGGKRGGGQRDWAFSGPSAERVELGAWQPCRFSCLPAPCALRCVPFLEAVRSLRRGPSLYPAAGAREVYLMGS